MNKQFKDISIVIATLGGPSLIKVLNCISKQSINVREIIVCLPHDSQLFIEFNDLNNIKLCFSEKKGQVAQRSEGLKSAKGEFVLQLDDDIYFNELFLKSIVDSISMVKNKAAIAPLIKNYDSKKYITTYEISIKNIIKSIFTFIVAGAPWGHRRMGLVDRGGIPYAIDKNFLSNNELVNVEWLPGGCIICHRKNLILEDYYPFTGKAYSEDLIHALLWRERGVQLFIDTNLYVYTEIDLDNKNFSTYYHEFRARNYYLNLCKKNILTSVIYFCITIVKYFFNLILKKISKLFNKPKF